MKLMIIGPSPYLRSSNGKLVKHAIEHLVEERGHTVAVVAWDHDINYFTPDDTGPPPRWYYSFYDHGEPRQKRDVPLFPILPRTDPTVLIYEIMKSVEPEAVITVGDPLLCHFMPALQQFGNEFAWIALFANWATPINEQLYDLLRLPDAILSTNKFTVEQIEKIGYSKPIDYCYVGYKSEEEMAEHGSFDIIPLLCSSSTNLQVDNTAAVMEVASFLNMEIPESKLLLNANVHDRGGVDLGLVQARLDPDEKAIVFPDTFVSKYDQLPEDQFIAMLRKSDIYVDFSMCSSTGMGVFEAMSHGCYPILSDCGVHPEIAELLEEQTEGWITAEDILVSCVHFMSTNGSYMAVVDQDDAICKIKALSKKIQEKAGRRRFLAESVDGFCLRGFLKALDGMIESSGEARNILSIETL